MRITSVIYQSQKNRWIYLKGQMPLDSQFNQNISPNSVYSFIIKCIPAISVSCMLHSAWLVHQPQMTICNFLLFSIYSP